MKKFKFKIFALFLCSFFYTCLQAESSETSDAVRPNFIHIMVDDMAADSMGFSGRFTFMETPNIDKMAERGVVFNQFFVTTSLCSPSRASILTGRYAHGTGIPDNLSRRVLDPSLPTYPQLLQEAGYVTAHIGKWHMGSDDQPRPGFSHWYGMKRQGVYFDPVMNRNGKQELVKGYMTDIITEEALAFIRANRDKPFALNLWHKAAHLPFQPAPRHADVFENVNFPKPETWDNDYRDRPSWMRRAGNYGVHLQPWRNSEGKPIPESIPATPFTRKSTARFRNHLSTLLAVDDSLGRIMAMLEELDLFDSTVVVFTADNGFFLGEYRRSDKRLQDEASIRVPMILQYPPLNNAGESISAIGLNIDFAPTILDWAGVEIPGSMQGESLRPLIEGKTDKVRDQFLYEYFQEQYAPGIPTILALRNENWKYVHYPYDPTAFDELFDLNSDPYEQFSVAGKPEYADRLESMKLSMEEEMQRTEYRRPSYHYDPANYPEKMQ